MKLRFATCNSIARTVQYKHIAGHTYSDRDVMAGTPVQSQMKLTLLHILAPTGLPSSKYNRMHNSIIIL